MAAEGETPVMSQCKRRQQQSDLSHGENRGTDGREREREVVLQWPFQNGKVVGQYFWGLKKCFNTQTFMHIHMTVDTHKHINTF